MGINNSAISVLLMNLQNKGLKWCDHHKYNREFLLNLYLADQ